MEDMKAKFEIGWGVRQCDTISPKLLTATLESVVIKLLDWVGIGNQY